MCEPRIDWSEAVTISKDHLDNVCRPGEGPATCAFLTMEPGSGMVCAKGGPVEPTILIRLAAGTMNAQGDNCPGWDVVSNTTG